MEDRFNDKARAVIEKSTQIAAEFGRATVGSEHLILAIASDEGPAGKVMRQNGLNPRFMRELLEKYIGRGSERGTVSTMTSRCRSIFEQAYREAVSLHSKEIGVEHLLLAILRMSDCAACRLISVAGGDINKIYTELLRELQNTSAEKKTARENSAAELAEDGENEGEGSPLEQYGRDLTALAKEGKLDPVIGRNNEVQRVIQILSRRTKNNPVLVGEPGVGKTAIAEGLAQRMVSGDVPEDLAEKKLISLDLTAMLAGTKYRGDFEERIKGVMKEVQENGSIVLFIDELHTIIGAGAAEGAIDAANIIKPALSRGELQIIGATTLAEYRKYIEKDAALERRFQPVTVNEPTEEETVEIIKGLREKYETHHKLKISDEAVEAAVKLSVRYIADRYLPDKAIDLMDEAASRVRLTNYAPPKGIKDIEARIHAIEAEKDEAIKAQDYEQAALLRDREAEQRSELAKAKNDWNAEQSGNGIVNAEDIAEVVAGWTGIPVTSLTENEAQRLLKMESILHARVVGQNEAVSAVSKAIRRGRIGLKDPKRPIGSFLFLGPTGVGKTELCKALAEAVFGDENAMIRIDMSEYMEKYTVSKLIGSPPGYVGFEEGGQLTEKVRTKPYSVVLFDEIEKASEDIFNILLQILDDGRLTDGKGRTVSFKNTVIVMTSNIGARDMMAGKRQTVGFGGEESSERSYEEMRSIVTARLKSTFRPEFLNRIDDTIVFHPLQKEDIRKITDTMLNTVRKRIESIGLSVEFTEEAMDKLCEAGFDPEYGARPLRRTIQSLVEDAVAESMLDGTLKEGDKAIATVEGDKLCIKKAE